MSLPPLKASFPQIKSLMVDIQYLSQHGHILEESQATYSANDPIALTLNCPGGCEDGRISIESKLASLVQQRLESAQAQSKCANPLYIDTKPCGCELKCKFQLEYYPEPPEES